MSKNREEIARKVRDGSYFKDAQNWYSGKYLYPVAERAMMFLFASATIFALIPIATLVKTSVQSDNSVPVPIIVEDSTSHQAIISPLAKNGETAQEAVAKYLISDYVKARENYSYNVMGNNDERRMLIKKIKSSSAKSVLDEYNNYMSEANPYSPLVKYKDHTKRVIDIVSVQFIDKDKASGKAKVLFKATEISNDGTEQKSMWEALIHFRIPDVYTIAKTGAPLRFIAGYYRTKPLESQNKNATVKKDSSE